MPDPNEIITPVVSQPDFHEPLLNEAAIVREYQKPNVSPDHVATDIPEPQFKAPTDDFLTEAPEQSEAQTGPKEPANNEHFNPQFTEMNKKDQRTGAEMMADTAIGGYKFLCEQGLSKFAQLNVKKIERHIAAGEIDPTIKFDIDTEGNQANIRQYAEVFNESVSKNFEVSQDFVDEVREPLIRICMKKGVGLTDEQMVGIAVGKDLFLKGLITMQLRDSHKTMVEHLAEQTRMMRASGYTPQQAAPQPQQAAQPQNVTNVTPAPNHTSASDRHAPASDRPQIVRADAPEGKFPSDHDGFIKGEMPADIIFQPSVSNGSFAEKTPLASNMPAIGMTDKELAHMDNASRRGQGNKGHRPNASSKHNPNKPRKV